MSPLTICMNLIKKADQFGDSVNFEINGHQKFKTIPSGLCSILLMIIIGAYSLYQFSEMLLYGNTLVTEYKETDHFS